MVGTDKELGIAPMDTNDFSPMIKQWIDAKAEISSVTLRRRGLAQCGDRQTPWDSNPR